MSVQTIPDFRMNDASESEDRLPAGLIRSLVNLSCISVHALSFVLQIVLPNCGSRSQDPRIRP
jgi:hypothetical protein